MSLKRFGEKNFEKNQRMTPQSPKQMTCQHQPSAEGQSIR